MSTFRERYDFLFREWALDESKRSTRVLADNATPEKQLRKAASDFTNGRFWPAPVTSGSGPRFLWELFQCFTGITDHSPLQAVYLDSRDHDLKATIAATYKVSSYRLLDHDLRLAWFLRKPAEAISLFLSLCSRRVGASSGSHTRCVAYLLEFFLKFLQRNDILPGNSDICDRALRVVEVAKTEAFDATNAGKMLPDCCSHALRLMWGLDAQGFDEDPGDDNAFTDPLHSFIGGIENDLLGFTAPSIGAKASAGYKSVSAPSVICDNFALILPRAAIKQEDHIPQPGPTSHLLLHTVDRIEPSLRDVNRAILAPQDMLIPPSQSAGDHEPDPSASMDLFGL